MSLDWKDFQGVNAAVVAELYDKFLADPRSVDEATRALFEQASAADLQRLTQSGAVTSRVAPDRDRVAADDQSLPPHLVVGAVNLAQSIRLYGHLAAQIDPLGSRPVGDPALQPETHGVTEQDLRALPPSLLEGPVTDGASSMWDVVERLRAIYCSTTGYDIAHIFVPEEREWLREVIETGRYRAPNDPIDPIALLDRLTDVEVVRAIPAPDISRQDPLLDRGTRHARADPR